MIQPISHSSPKWLEDLQNDAAKGDGSALLDLARLFLAGRDVPRDLSRARAYFAEAANAGVRIAAEIHRAFVANGTGAQPDWQGAMRLLNADVTDPDAARQIALISAMKLDGRGYPQETSKAEVLCAAPLITRFPNFVTAAESDYLMDRALPRFQPALIVHPVTRTQVPDPIRTSDVAGFPLVWEQPAIRAINLRIASVSGTDIAAGEPLTVLRYRPGQRYRLHLDTLPGERNQRVATMLIYLNDGYLGGETSFPKLDLKIKVRKGDAVLFANVSPNGQPDPASLHEGMPVLSGEKLIASRWIRRDPILF